MTTDVYRFEHWPDFSFDDPDLIRIANQTFQWQLAATESPPPANTEPTPDAVWGFDPNETLEQKFQKFMSKAETAYETITQALMLDWFAYKMYKNDYLVAIYTGYLTTTIKGKTFHAGSLFVGADENGNKGYVGGIEPFKGLIEFMSQFGVVSYKEYLLVGHPKIEWLRQTYGVEPTSIEQRPIGPDGTPVLTYVYELFDQLKNLPE